MRSLNKNSVHIYSLCTDNYSEHIPQLETFLGSEDQARLNTLHQADFKNNFIISRGLLRSILSTYTGIAAAEIKLQRNQHGKPLLAESMPAIQFNMTHTQSRLLIALSSENTVGIDIENRHRKVKMAQLAQKIMSGNELAYFQTLDQEQQVQVFFENWTAKEAYLKATGEGISAGMNQIEIIRTENGLIIKDLRNRFSDQRWFLYQLENHADFIATLAVNSDKLTIVKEELDVRNLN